MLKIGSVRWRGKCSKHPGYDPVDGGIGAVKGNCARCNELVEIYEHHQKMLRLMRQFQPAPVKRKAASANFLELQQNLFS
jgi:hypothetical protein